MAPGRQPITLREDIEFNKDKGRLSIEHKDDSPEWRIKVLDINGSAMLRLRMSTEYQGVTSRADTLSLPFTVTTPRNR